MTRPWQTLAVVETSDGPLELRRRGDDFLIVVGGRVLMSSTHRRSEEALATLACARIVARPTPRVLVGGLGMGFTLRATLGSLPAAAQVIVAELNPEIVAWCRGPLAPATASAVTDARVTVEIADVAKVIGAAPADCFDAIILDLYEGPYAATQRKNDPLYGAEALARTHRALAGGGVVAIWSEDADPSFPARLEAAGFHDVTVERVGGGRTHIIYLAVR